jgi:2-hydroxy-6-oxonona-2,4-dienedioate hydrolase
VALQLTGRPGSVPAADVRVRFADFAGIRTRYYEAGAGEPLLFIHGVGVTAEVWWRNLAQLAQRHHVLAPDMLGSGFTDAGNYSGGPIHPHVVEHLVCMVEALGIDSFAVAGGSIGALFATLLYLRLPQRVTKLVLVSSGSMFNSDADYVQTWKRTYENGRTAFINPSYDVCFKRAAGVVYDPASIPPEMILMQMSSYARPGALELFERRALGALDLEAARPYRVLDRLAEIRIPTLAIFGRNDLRANWQSAQEAISRMPHARLEVYDACGHYPQMEHPEEFNRSVLAFLADPGKGD